MGLRLDLHAKLIAIPGVEKVYFQPPEKLDMKYPCIRYVLSDKSVAHAANHSYRLVNRYQLIVIDRNPDSPIPAVLDQFPMIRFSRFYTAEGLNHFVYELYF